MSTIEISFDTSYQCGVSTPHLIVSDHETFMKIISCIPDGQQFLVGHVEDGKVTGRGYYVAGREYVFTIYETGTCAPEEEQP